MQLTVSASPLPEYAGAYASCGENVWGKGDERIYLAKGFWVLGTAADQREGIGWIASCDEAGDRMPWEVARWRYFAEGAECWAEVGGLVVQRCGDSADGARVPWCVTGAGGAIVRDGISMRSRVVQKLAKGAVVFVLEVQGRRARITEPPGWMSTAASTGESILSPLQTSGPRGNSFPYPAPASSLGSSPPGFVRSPAARAASTHATHFSSANRSITTPASHPTSAPMSPLLDPDARVFDSPASRGGSTSTSEQNTPASLAPSADPCKPVLLTGCWHVGPAPEMRLEIAHSEGGRLVGTVHDPLDPQPARPPQRGERPVAGRYDAATGAVDVEVVHESAVATLRLRVEAGGGGAPLLRGTCARLQQNSRLVESDVVVRVTRNDPRHRLDARRRSSGREEIVRDYNELRGSEQRETPEILDFAHFEGAHTKQPGGEVPLPASVEKAWAEGVLPPGAVEEVAECLRRDLAAALGVGVSQVSVEGGRVRLSGAGVAERYEAVSAAGHLPVPETKAALQAWGVCASQRMPDGLLRPSAAAGAWPWPAPAAHAPALARTLPPAASGAYPRMHSGLDDDSLRQRSLRCSRTVSAMDFRKRIQEIEDLKNALQARSHPDSPTGQSS